MLFLVEIEMKFCRNFANMLKNVQIHQNFQKICNFSRKICEISGIEKIINSIQSLVVRCGSLRRAAALPRCGRGSCALALFTERSST